jgi:hypothetical protein
MGSSSSTPNDPRRIERALPRETEIGRHEILGEGSGIVVGGIEANGQTIAFQYGRTRKKKATYMA